MIIDDIDGSVIDIEQITRRNGKILGYGVWISQGSKDDPSEIWIQSCDINRYISALEKAKTYIEQHDRTINL